MQPINLFRRYRKWLKMQTLRTIPRIRQRTVITESTAKLPPTKPETPPVRTTAATVMTAPSQKPVPTHIAARKAKTAKAAITRTKPIPTRLTRNIDLIPWEKA